MRADRVMPTGVVRHRPDCTKYICSGGNSCHPRTATPQEMRRLPVCRNCQRRGAR